MKVEQYEDLINPEKWYSAGELAIVFDVSVDTIRRRIVRGQLEAVLYPQEIRPKGKPQPRVYRVAKVLGIKAIEFMRKNSLKKK